MIGDQLQRDIAPAKAAELTTIYVPGRFKPRWEPHEHVVGPSYSVQSFDQAVEIILHGKSKADTPARRPRKVVHGTLGPADSRISRESE